MSNRVFKNYQINLGVPFQVKVPLDAMYDGQIEGTGFDGEFRGAAADGYGDGWLTSAGRSAAEGAYGASSADGTSSAENGGLLARVDGMDIDISYDGSAFGTGRAGGDGDEAETAEDAAARARAEAEAAVREANAEAVETLARAEREAERIIDAARQEAAKTVEQALAEAEADAAKIRVSARTEALADGRAEGRAEYDSLVAEAERIRNEAEDEYRELIAGAEGDALELVLGIARKVVGDEFVHNRQNLLMLIKDAFKHCTNKEQAVLRVSADDYDYIRANRDVMLSMVEGVGKLEIKRDLSLGAGSCFVETPFGSIDAGVATRLSKIEDAFYKLLPAQRATA